MVGRMHAPLDVSQSSQKLSTSLGTSDHEEEECLGLCAPSRMDDSELAPSSTKSSTVRKKLDATVEVRSTGSYIACTAFLTALRPFAAHESRSRRERAGGEGSRSVLASLTSANDESGRLRFVDDVRFILQEPHGVFVGDHGAVLVMVGLLEGGAPQRREQLRRELCLRRPSVGRQHESERP